MPESPEQQQPEMLSPDHDDEEIREEALQAEDKRDVRQQEEKEITTFSRFWMWVVVSTMGVCIMVAVAINTGWPYHLLTPPAATLPTQDTEAGGNPYAGVQQFIWYTLQAALGKVRAIVVWAPSLYWEVFLQIPMLTFFFTVVFLLVGCIWQRRRLKLDRERQLQHLRVRMRQYVYRLLSAAPQEPHPIVLVREGFLYDPNFTVDKDTLKVVWPLVEFEISEGNRVRTGRVMKFGVSMESWQWSERASGPEVGFD